MSKHPAFAVWSSMLARCTRPSHKAWSNYGGRGITVCKRWQKSFSNFWVDMGKTYQPGLSLDRINNNAGYRPKNCHWATSRQQAQNTRRARYVQTLLGTMNIQELARLTGIAPSTLYYRLVKRVSPVQLVEHPNISRKFTT
ncbi:P46 [Hamiltonella phage APSE-1]|uniref:Uncharacterized protein P46 n=2 Tax=Sendosyvirus TaxID=2843452 RepID=Q3LZN2_9CAUD|nr:HNH endonuclease [Hamiltonella phage APSE-1]AAF03989.1 P46 [Hamiltonella phage APSE-1]ABA29402.1 conserved hypothetical protein [Bacteriophage APSE-2]